MSFYLALVSPTDSPLYESSFPSSRSIAGSSTSTAASASSSSYTSGGGGGGGGGSGAFPSWSSFTGMNGVDLGDRLGRGSADLVRPPGAGVQGQQQQQSGATATAASTINPQGPGAGGDRALMQMIAFKSLDGVEEVMETTGGLYLRNVDKWNEWTVSAFLANGVRFILLHDHRNDDGIRQFFLEIWELWVKVLLNPFQTVNTPIRSAAFDGKVRAAAKRLL